MKLAARLRMLALAGGFICVIGLAGTRHAYAQGGASTGTMAGRVVDDTGAVLPGVAITLTNLATNQPRTTVTNEAGLYRFASIQPAKYSLTAELAGFATYVRTEVTVNVGCGRRHRTLSCGCPTWPRPSR